MKYIAFFILFFILSCNTDKIIGEVTECGGSFDNRLLIKASKLSNRVLEERDTCYNTLNWKYDKEKEKLTFIDDKALFNCCGSRSIVAFKKDNSYILKEIEEDGYCNCSCSYSFFIEIYDVNEDIINVELKRKINDNDSQTVLNTKIKLSENEGRVIINQVACRH